MIAMGEVDAHTHVWSDDPIRYPLAPGADTGHMDLPRFNGDDVLAMLRPHGLRRAVLVQSSFYGADHALLADTIAAHPRLFRGIASLGPPASDIATAMQQLAAKGIRGFRIVGLGAADPHWLDTPGYAAMFDCAAAHRWVICPLLDPAALPALAAMCRRFPTTPVVIDHLARIGADGVIRDADVAQLCALAALPQVHVKVSAFYGLGRKTPPYDDLAPLIRRVHHAYGATRLLWASDGPYGHTRGSYAAAIGLIRDRLDFLSATDRSHLLARTAHRLFFRE